MIEIDGDESNTWLHEPTRTHRSHRHRPQHGAWRARDGPCRPQEEAAIRHSVGMDAATVRAMLEQHFTTSDPNLSHAMYPARTAVEFREIRGFEAS